MLQNQGVHNLSKTTVLTADQQLFLSLGLKFIPPCKINKILGKQIEDSLNFFKRTVRIRKQFINNETTTVKFLRIPNPAFQPEKAPFGIENYLKVAERRLAKKVTAYLRQRPQQDPSLHWFEVTLASIKALPGIIIKPSDKGYETVIHDLSDYRNECLRQLSDNLTYVVDSPHYPRVWAQLRSVLHKHGKLFNSSPPRLITPVAKYLLQLQHHRRLRLARFYCLTKLHKDPVVGRPIVAGIDTATYYGSKLLDHHFKKYLHRIPSYLQSSEHLLVILEQFRVTNPNCVLVAADVTSLYPNIPIPEGLRALRAQLLKWGELASETEFLVDLAEWVLTHNYLEFNGVTYRQISGTAMGTPFAVVFANIFLAFLEAEILREKPTLIPPLLKRFVDDLFFITDTVEAANSFVTEYNSRYPTIKLTVTMGDSVNYMDLRIHKGQRFQRSGKLDIELYASSTKKFLYLPPWSNHPANIFPSFIAAERRRIRMNCSDDTAFAHHDDIFRQRLLARGYTDMFLQPIFDTAYVRATLIDSATQRTQRRAARSLRPTARPAAAGEDMEHAPLIFKTQYSPLTKAVRLRHGLKFTQSALDDIDAPYIFTPRSPVMCYTRGKNLSDLLCSSLFAATPAS